MMAAFTLPKQHVPLLGTLWPGDRNALSPLAGYGTPKERDGAKELLAGSEVMDPAGQIDVRFHHVMSVLDDPERFVSLDVMTHGNMKSLEVYYSTDKVSVVSFLSVESGTVQVREDAGLHDILLSDDLEYTPNNELTPADITLSLLEAWIAAAIFDRERCSALAAVMQANAGQDLLLEPSVHDPASIMDTFTRAGSNPELIFFLNLLDGMGGMDRSDVDFAGIKQHLESLDAKGILRRSESGYSVPELMLPMIRRTLIFDKMINVRTGRKDEAGRIVTESSLCIRADGALLWFIRPEQTSVQIFMKYVSSSMESDILHQLIENVSYSLAQLTVLPPMQPTYIKKKFCSQCGATVKAGLKFCSSCGTKIA
ncbi:MAG: zinc ribbon domain-containing protein [Methanoregula sp.]|nr:zinc ribbon domain-containing protein [Methanoregula sp.]